MDKAQMKAVLTTAGAKEGEGGWWEIADGKSVALYAAHNGASLAALRSVAIRVDGEIVYARTAKGETYIFHGDDLFAAAVEGSVATATRKAGFL